MKQKELDSLGHFMMMQTAQSTAEAVKVFEETKNKADMTNKNKAELYEQIIRCSVSNVKNIATIMNAAQKNSNFRFRRKDVMQMTIADVANALGIKVERGDCKGEETVSEPKKDDFEVTEIKLPKDVNDKLIDALMSIIEKNKGKK